MEIVQDWNSLTAEYNFGWIQSTDNIGDTWDSKFIALSKFLIDRLKKIPGAFGCVTVQVFGNPQTGEIKGLEINPRFGGGYPLTSAAGCSYAELIIREYLL